MKKILVADDDAGIVDVMQILLEDDGFFVITTMDGKKVKLLCKENPDMIFLDIWMSGVDGKVICKELKADPKTSNIPVVMFSANRDTKEIALECGANDFILKPFEIEELLALAHKYTR
ncbi:MAG: response regulator [Bacteroidota bacterium]|nr:response regulator [Bacteroidota bacterium]MDQ6889940.1 response regulator [Bacteroidota bacterium]